VLKKHEFWVILMMRIRLCFGKQKGKQSLEENGVLILLVFNGFCALSYVTVTRS
jgi:hypothetical protein